MRAKQAAGKSDFSTSYGFAMCEWEEVMRLTGCCSECEENWRAEEVKAACPMPLPRLWRTGWRVFGADCEHGAASICSKFDTFEV